MTVRDLRLTSKAALSSMATALATMSAASSAVAQDAESPPPASSPSRSIDFRLPPANDGRAPGVQGPADNGLPPLSPGERSGPTTPTPTPTPTPAPSPSAPRVVPPQPAVPAAPASPPPGSARPGARTAAPAPPAASTAAPAQEPAADLAPAPDAASAPTQGPAAASQVAAEDSTLAADAAVDRAAASGSDRDATPLWAWLLAALAAALAGLWYWRRRPVSAPDTPLERHHLADAPPTPPASPPPPPPPPPPASPRTPTPHAPDSQPEPPPASPLVTRPLGEQRARVSIELDIRSIQILPDRVEIGFSLTATNKGELAATGMMVRIAAGQGSAMQEAVLARFFDGAGGSVLRDDMLIAPGAGEQLSTEIALPRAAIEPLMIGGKPMLVPVVAFDITYHWDGPGEAFGQHAESFVLGRLTDAGEKLAPLPLDHAKHRVERPGVRSTAVRRVQ